MFGFGNLLKRRCLLVFNRRCINRRSAVRNTGLALIVLMMLINYSIIRITRVRTKISTYHSYKNIHFKRSIERSTLWGRFTGGVLNCRTGEIVRHLPLPRTANVLNKGILIDIHNLTTPETTIERQRAFVKIFFQKLWKGQENTTTANDHIFGSGSGSTLENSVNVTATLDIIISQVKEILGK